jgi:hypothetical protein
MSFWRGNSNVSVTYICGFVVQGEAQMIPGGPGPYGIAVNAPNGNWAVDQGVHMRSAGQSWR